MSKAPSRFILHLDGDAFFASVELASRPDLRGKPVVTGSERGIATALSYEAKALGVTRGMPVYEIRKMFPEVTVLSSHYDDYMIYSLRLQSIVRNYVDAVEPYSIDECFAECSGTIEETIEKGRSAKLDIKEKLGITVSLGIAPTKVLAKIASKREKPNGLTVIDDHNLTKVLQTTKASSLWGIGRELSQQLREYDIETAYELYEKSRPWIYERFHKNLREMWHELHGESVMSLNEDPDEDFQSIARSRTFRPCSEKMEIVYAELVHNLEDACAKARRFLVSPRHIYFFIKTKEFRYFRNDFLMSHPTNHPSLILHHLRPRFEKLFEEGCIYRATGVTLSSLIPECRESSSLFGDEIKDAQKKIWEAVDGLNQRFGDNTISLASAQSSIEYDGGVIKKPLCIPSLGIAK